MSVSAAAANSSAYWRAAGMSYLKYSNLCAEVVRASLKEPALAKAKAREMVYFKTTKMEAGKAVSSVVTEVTPSGA
eukprot:CAMPEP_0183790772 /NCGR_PEP_ID=MMETSP0803_2-20130417/1348_1 /TAXON_ID=195967 /ORGANISM="Crustomastix stigmata, Strain CCMP3273" /LENGTH=75 /DNA_ID=CAMNT_0026035035 /DNA_START=43 /DNA_END=270 /DNA_ORIENTATION=-